VTHNKETDMSKPIAGRRPFVARALGVITALPLVQACTGTAPR
jgi:hypothetical protein